jgi:hypothetical protein
VLLVFVSHALLTSLSPVCFFGAMTVLVDLTVRSGGGGGGGGGGLRRQSSGRGNYGANRDGGGGGGGNQGDDWSRGMFVCYSIQLERCYTHVSFLASLRSRC